MINPAEKIILRGFENKAPEFATAWECSQGALELGTYIKDFNMENPIPARECPTK